MLFAHYLLSYLYLSSNCYPTSTSTSPLAKVETGAHNVLTTVATQTLYCHNVRNVRSATSMKRGQEEGKTPSRRAAEVMRPIL